MVISLRDMKQNSDTKIVIASQISVEFANWPLGNLYQISEVVFKQISVVDGNIPQVLLDIADDKSVLVQVMAWCLQATSHYLSQCLRRSMSAYSVTRPQWFDTSDCQLYKLVKL